MQTWAKRGIQTALVTGGLLMLGTGIASADENVDPDRPASPLDLSLKVPVHTANNAIGTPFGQKDLPNIDRDITISGEQLTGALPKPAADAAAPVTDQLRKATSAAAHGKAAKAAGDPFRGNRVDGDLVAPIDISGNAIALGGNAEVQNTSSQQAYNSSPVTTDGTSGPIAGNVVNLDWTQPVQITGNAGSLIGNAKSTNTSEQSAGNGGDVTTDGTGQPLSGNVLNGQAATPLQVTGNAVAGGGNAETENYSSTEAGSIGSLFTSGNEGVGSGNVGALPIGSPVEVNGQALSGLGKASSISDTAAAGGAGSESEGRNGVPTYIQTYAERGVLSGNVGQPSLSGPGVLSGNSGSLIGKSDALGTTDSAAKAGGTSQSSGEGSVLSGTIADGPVALPAEAFGNAATLVGDAKSSHQNEVVSVSGGSAYTRGHDSVGGGSIVAPAAAVPADLFCNAVGAIGNAEATSCGNDSKTAAGGHTGTTGSGSVVGGNDVVAPVALPVEGFANSAGGIGTAAASGEETKITRAGGDNNTNDDAGVLASNLAQVPVAGPLQAFGNTGGAIANTEAYGDGTSQTTAGGDSIAHGPLGVLAGNIAQAPVALPGQVLGHSVNAGGTSDGMASNDTTSTSGGDATTDGTGGVGTGNVASVPAAGIAQLFGNAASALGLSKASTDSTTDSTAGGTVDTTGEYGTVAGNVASPQALAVAQVIHDSVSVIGFSTTEGTNDATGTSGGDITSNGDHGVLSGNLADVPVAALGHLQGDSLAVLGYADTYADSIVVGSAGGTSETSGDSSQLSGIDGTLPLGGEVRIFDVPLPILGEAMAEATNITDLTVGEERPQLNLPISGDVLPANKVPTLPGRYHTMAGKRQAADVPAFGSLPVNAPAVSQIVDQVRVALPGGTPMMPRPLPALPGKQRSVPALPGGDLVQTVQAVVGQLTGGVAAPQLPGVPALPGKQRNVPALPGGDLVQTVQAVVGQLTGGVAAPQLPGVPALPGKQRNVPALPGGDLVQTVQAVVGQLTGGVAAPQLPGVPALPGKQRNVPALPGGDLVQTVQAVVGQLTGGVAAPQLPGVPALPGKQRNVPNVQLPAVGQFQETVTGLTGNLPAAPGLPGVPSKQRNLPNPNFQLPATGQVRDVVTKVTGGLPGQTGPITKPNVNIGGMPADSALSNLDAVPAMNPHGMVDPHAMVDEPMLTDTVNKLRAAFSHHPIG
ncbi:small secreted domain DUF320 [Herbihabitans rhizosphaerae]|uniref:Small secreted domain DUF320 n=1 Tax=Herbihabitans rhizosphaerae TaxID=1872711 RepID=A0A4Q7KMU4_9PSEU|nr:chaplin family protein [Herbihabitans rhizosphaerae]RZS37664.1 small secreted domain DUF320 [Herbihabitans rhizosphaerae]